MPGAAVQYNPGHGQSGTWGAHQTGSNPSQDDKINLDNGHWSNPSFYANQPRPPKAKCPDQTVGWDCSNDNQMQSTCLQKCPHENRYATKKCICRDGQCLWKQKGRECLDEDFGSGGGSNGGYSGGSNIGNPHDQNIETGHGNGSETGSGTGNGTGSGGTPDQDFYKNFQKMLTHTMDISIARSTINLYL